MAAHMLAGRQVGISPTHSPQAEVIAAIDELSALIVRRQRHHTDLIEAKLVGGAGQRQSHPHAPSE